MSQSLLTSSSFSILQKHVIRLSIENGQELRTRLQTQGPGTDNIYFDRSHLNSASETKHRLREEPAAFNNNLIRCGRNTAYELGLNSFLISNRKGR